MTIMCDIYFIKITLLCNDSYLILTPEVMMELNIIKEMTILESPMQQIYIVNKKAYFVIKCLTLDTPGVFDREHVVRKRS